MAMKNTLIHKSIFLVFAIETLNITILRPPYSLILYMGQSIKE